MAIPPLTKDRMHNTTDYLGRVTMELEEIHRDDITDVDAAELRRFASQLERSAKLIRNRLPEHLRGTPA